MDSQCANLLCDVDAGACRADDGAVVPAVPIPKPSYVLTLDGFAGAKITAQGISVVVGAQDFAMAGLYGNTPFSLSASLAGYWPQTLEEVVLIDSGTLTDLSADMISNAEASLFISSFTGYDDTKGVLGVSVIAMTGCAGVAGATLEVQVGGAHVGLVSYLSDDAPSVSATSVSDAYPFLSAAVYNLPVGVPLTLTAKHPSCHQMPYPVTVSPVVFTGNVRVSAGATTSYTNVFLE